MWKLMCVCSVGRRSESASIDDNANDLMSGYINNNKRYTDATTTAYHLNGYEFSGKVIGMTRHTRLRQTTGQIIQFQFFDEWKVNEN